MIKSRSRVVADRASRHQSERWFVEGNRSGIRRVAPGLLVVPPGPRHVRRPPFTRRPEERVGGCHQGCHALGKPPRSSTKRPRPYASIKPEAAAIELGATKPDGAVRGFRRDGSRLSTGPTERAVRRANQLDRTLPGRGWQLSGTEDYQVGQSAQRSQLTLPPAGAIRSAYGHDLGDTVQIWTWEDGSLARTAQVASRGAGRFGLFAPTIRSRPRSAFSLEATATLARPWTRRHSGPEWAASTWRAMFRRARHVDFSGRKLQCQPT